MFKQHVYLSQIASEQTFSYTAYNTMKEENYEWLQNIHFFIQNRHGPQILG